MNRSTVSLAIGLFTAAIYSSVLGGAVISVPEKEWDFGVVPQQSTVSHEYWIKNIGDDTLRNIIVKPG